MFFNTKTATKREKWTSSFFGRIWNNFFPISIKTTSHRNSPFFFVIFFYFFFRGGRNLNNEKHVKRGLYTIWKEKKNSRFFLFHQLNQKGEPLTEDESNLARSYYSINNTLNNYLSKFENKKKWISGFVSNSQNQNVVRT